MAEKKEETKVKIATKPIAKKEKAIKKAEPKKATEKKVAKKVEQQFFAADLAEKMGMRSFDFFLIKRQAGITDSTPITMSEMKELYNKIIEGR